MKFKKALTIFALISIIAILSIGLVSAADHSTYKKTHHAKDSKYVKNSSIKYKFNLTTNPSTGYQWKIVKHTKNVKLVSKTIKPIYKGDICGAPEKEYFVFKGTSKKGPALVKLYYVSPAGKTAKKIIVNLKKHKVCK